MQNRRRSVSLPSISCHRQASSVRSRIVADSDEIPRVHWLARWRARLPRGMRRVNWMMGIWSTLIFLFLYIPIVILVIWSFNSASMGSEWKGGTTQWYRAFWYSCMYDLREYTAESDSYWWRPVRYLADAGGAERFPELKQSIIRAGSNRGVNEKRIFSNISNFSSSLINSLIIGVLATVVSVALGTLSAWLTFKYKYPLRNLLNTLVAVPMIVPEIIMGVSMLAFFSLLFQSFDVLGMSGEHVIRLFRWTWTFTLSPGLGYITVLIGHITFCFPFVMVTIQARLAGIDPALEEAAMDLGATPQKAFRKVIMPYLMPAIISGALMAFTLSLDDFIVTFFLTGNGAETLPVRIYQSVKGPPPMMHVVSSIMIGLTVLMVLLAEGVQRIGRHSD